MSDIAHGRDAIVRAGRATHYLLGLSAVLMAALAATFGYLVHRQAALQEGIREDALWAVYQLNREARALSETTTKVLFGGTPDKTAAQTLTLRYDFLYSRISILQNAQYAPFFEDSAEIAEARRRIRAQVMSFEPTFNAIAAGAAEGVSPAALAQLRALAAPMETLSAVTGSLLTSTNASVAAERADARAEIMRLQAVAAATVAALVAVTGLLILSLMRQVRLVKAAGNHLEAVARQLKDACSAADAGNRAKSVFMATIGHEIRTPLSAIIQMTELLADADLPAQDRANVAVIASSGAALLEIINEILDFSKLEHGDTAPEAVPFGLDALVAEVVRVMAGRAREQGDAIAVEVAPALRGRTLLGDPARLRRVLLNLVSNAVKFTANGAITIRASEAAGSRLRVEVVDSGIGIAPDARNKLFKAFSQVDGTISRRFGGTGLGLAICKRIVESLGGTIGVDSEPGRGSTFWFEVPAVDAPAQERPEAAPSAGEALPRLHVLLVEDNPVNRAAACQFLAKLDQRVTIARDGNEAIAAANAERFDLIFMDMQMPGLDGIAATRRIRGGANPNTATPIVAITANASDSDRRLCLQAGMDRFETKPMPLARLRSLIATYAPADAPRATGAPPPPPPPPPSSDATATLIADERRAELIDAVGEDGYRALAELFFEDAAQLVADLAAATAAGDEGLFDRTLHSLKGAASNLGFSDFAATAQALRAPGPRDAAGRTMAAALDSLIHLHARRAA